MNKIVDDNIELIKQLCKNHHVKSLFAFGSVCTEQFNDTSDVDLLISFENIDYADYADNYFLLADKLEAVFKRHVDLVTEKSLSNPYFIDSVNRTKKLIYGY
jgi:predicted nucleotidyltransferase